MLVFLHIFKTGGTSLYRMMSKVYGGGYVLANPPDIKRRVTQSTKALAGHIQLTPQHMKILGSLNRELTYITMLREPIDRAISDYYWIKHHDFEYKIPRDKSLPELLKMGFFRGNNTMTRYLSGVTEPDLDLAKNRLKYMIDEFGFMEEFDEFVGILRDKFGWPEIQLGHEKRNTQRPAEVSADTIDAVKEYNQLDLELYDYARKLYRERYKH